MDDWYNFVELTLTVEEAGALQGELAKECFVNDGPLIFSPPGLLTVRTGALVLLVICDLLLNEVNLQVVEDLFGLC